MKHRVFTVDTTEGPFRFLADNKELAEAHAWQLNRDSEFPAVTGKPKQIGWTEDYVGLDLDTVPVTVGVR